MGEVSEEEMQVLYQWIDEIPLSRPKRSISRDFSDGVLTAELVNNFFPKLVDLHNYSSANGVAQKQYNWKTLNQKVFKKMGFHIAADELETVCNCGPGAIERVLRTVKEKVDAILANGGKFPQQPKAKKPKPQVEKPQHQQPASAPAADEKAAEPKRGHAVKGAKGGAIQNNPPPRRQPVVAFEPEAQVKQQANNNKLLRERSHSEEQKEQVQGHQQRQQVRRQSQSPPPRNEEARPTYNIPLMQQRGAPPRERQNSAPRVGGPVNMMQELDRSAHLNEPDMAQGLHDVDTEILVEKETTICELRETVVILETKIQKLEQLLRLKDQKIGKLMNAIESNV